MVHIALRVALLPAMPSTPPGAPGDEGDRGPLTSTTSAQQTFHHRDHIPAWVHPQTAEKKLQSMHWALQENGTPGQSQHTTETNLIKHKNAEMPKA
jgi:hypothetical protein